MRIILLVFCFVMFVGCAQTSQPVNSKNSDLTQGNVQMNIVVGETSKSDVLEHFGAPNVTTRDGAGRETWSYQRAAQVSRSQSSTNGWTVIFAGQTNASSGFETSSKMATIIIKFNSDDIVDDVMSRFTNF